MVPASPLASDMHLCCFFRASISATALEETQLPPALNTGLPSPDFRANLTTSSPADGSEMASENETEYFTYSSMIQTEMKGINTFLQPQA